MSEGRSVLRTQSLSFVPVTGRCWPCDREGGARVSPPEYMCTLDCFFCGYTARRGAVLAFPPPVLSLLFVDRWNEKKRRMSPAILLSTLF